MSIHRGCRHAAMRLCDSVYPHNSPAFTHIFGQINEAKEKNAVAVVTAAAAMAVTIE